MTGGYLHGIDGSRHSVKRFRIGELDSDNERRGRKEEAKVSRQFKLGR